jgi:transcriptional regulator with XRE-family HTH domain
MLREPGQKLRRWRLLRGIKQSAFADWMGVSQATISRWERGQLSLTINQWLLAERLLLSDRNPAHDSALQRLVETSVNKVHLVCDETHRLLAASPARQREWRADIAEFLGQSLIRFASDEVLAAEATLMGLGWDAGRSSSLEFDTSATLDPLIPIRQGRVLWERILLSDGSFGRLVTTIA